MLYLCYKYNLGGVRMDLNEFMGLPIQDQIQYINDQLDQGLKMDQIRSSIGIGEKKLQRYIKKNNYKYDNKTRRYICNMNMLQDPVHSEIKPSEATGEVTKVIEHKYNIDILPEVLEPDNQQKLINMLQMYDKLQDMYKWYEIQQLQDKVVDMDPPEIKVAINDNEVLTRSFRIYKDTYDIWGKFCKENSNYKVLDLLSMALLEYVDKYKK